MNEQATLNDLETERAAISAEIERASWQDYTIPSATWAHYWQIDAEIKQRQLSGE